MSSRPPARDRDSESRRIEEEAAAWFGRCEVGLTPENQDEFIRWLEVDERHREAVRSMDETWDFLDGMKEIDCWVRPTPQGSATNSRINRWAAVRLLLAAAAVLAVLLTGIWQPWKETPF